MYRITEEPIRPDALAGIVGGDDCGAVVTFAGTVRNHTGNRRTRYLEYEAYPEMAEQKMAEIGTEIKARWPVRTVAMIHRVGRLEVGEISVLIAVATPHRREAFAACEYAIDRLKKTVPIWKKEVWDEGEKWIEGENRPNLLRK